MPDVNQNISYEPYLITLSDAQVIINYRLIETFYIMYRGLSANDTESERRRKNLLRSYYTQVLKAFFCTSSTFTEMTEDMLVDHYEMKDELQKTIVPKETVIKNALESMKSNVTKFDGVNIKELELYFTMFGFARRFDALLSCFKVDKLYLLKALHAICGVNNSKVEVHSVNN